MVSFTPTFPLRRTTGLARLVVALCVALSGVCTATLAAAAVPWHADLIRAKEASQISRRPVLVLFVATWSPPSVSHDTTFLGTPESVALLTACFEPVRIDVDTDPAATKRLGVTHLPCACVIDPEERVLARFDCPESSAAFVAVAGRAAQEAAVACAGPLPPPAIAATVTPAPAAAPSTTPSSPDAARAPPPATSVTAPQSPPSGDAAVQAEPALGPTPPQWPAETVSTPLATTPSTAPGSTPPTTSAGSPTIEPGAQSASPPATGLASALPNWLAPKPPAAAPAASPAPADPAPKKSTGLWATIQKPFTSLVSKPQPAEASASQSPAEMPSTGVQAGEPGTPMPVGLEGYCAVTLVEKGTWAEGRAKWGVRHRGRTYLFAGPDEQRAFLANPDRYAPGLSGDDPVLALDAGRTVPGQRQYGVSYRSKVYLFSSPETQAAFKADPQKYSQRIQVAEQSGVTTVR